MGAARGATPCEGPVVTRRADKGPIRASLVHANQVEPQLMQLVAEVEEPAWLQQSLRFLVVSCAQ
eukprot:8241969-Lingulodinium_polyedra.AAC.1